MKRNTILSLLVIIGLLCSCGADHQQMPAANGADEAAPVLLAIDSSDFGATASGTAKLYTLSNSNGMMVRITNYGGIITELHTKDRNGKQANIALGLPTLADYQAGHPYFGAIIGRYGNRIGGATFSLDGLSYDLAKNNGPNSLHGGEQGFDKQLWLAKSNIGPVKSVDKQVEAVQLILSRVSPAGEENYPGNLAVTVVYSLTADDRLHIEYRAETDAATPINLTNHTYFNLKGAGKGNILDHLLTIAADSITPVDATLIPTGALMDVTGTPFDFRTPRRIGQAVDDTLNQQIAFGGGYDHNFVLQDQTAQLHQAATVYEPASGRYLETWTTEPGVQFYCGNFLDGSLQAVTGEPYLKRGGFCLETQHYPDAPNQSNFPNTILRPGEVYHSVTEYRFGVR